MNSQGSPCLLRQIYLPEGVGILAEMCPRVGVLLREGGVSNREIEHFVPLCRERGGGAKNDTNSRQKEALIYAYSPQTPATAVTNTSTGSTSDKHQRTNKRLTLLCALVLPLGGRTPRRSWVPSPAANHVSFAAGHSCLDGRTGQGQKKEKKVGVLIHPTGSRLCYGEVPSLIAVLSSQKVKRAARRGMYTRGKSTENPKRYRPNVTQHKEDAPCKCYVRGQQTSGLAG